MYYSYVPSPLGDLLVAGSDEALVALSFPTGSRRRDPLPEWIFSDRPFAGVRRQLGEYFAGERREFELPLAPAGTTFQRAVWDELGKIPYGTTVSYADIATRIGRPTALRAVGRANGEGIMQINNADDPMLGGSTSPVSIEISWPTFMAAPRIRAS